MWQRDPTFGENVSNYDVTFRHLMAQNLKRSWSKIYNQMWNLSMKHVLPRNTQQFSSGSGDYFNKRSGGGSQQGNANNNAGGNQKPKYCWGFNRTGNCKDGSKCKYVNRCSYCDGSDHWKINCPKKTAK